MYKKLILVVFLLGIAALGAFYFSPAVTPAEAQGSGDELTGWAWSSNIGWLSMNSDNEGASGPGSYAVAVDNEGHLNGYAWSSNIGWVDFGPEDVSDAPSNPKVSARRDGDRLIGWARVLTPMDNLAAAGGWDGWIKMAKGPDDDGGDYGIEFHEESGAYSDYAWGGDVVGWLSFSPGWPGGDGPDPNPDDPCDPEVTVCEEGPEDPDDLHLTCNADPTAVDVGQEVFVTSEMTHGQSGNTYRFDIDWDNPVEFPATDTETVTLEDDKTEATVGFGSRTYDSPRVVRIVCYVVDVTPDFNDEADDSVDVIVGSLCPNGVVDPGEECDGDEMGEHTIGEDCPVGCTGTITGCSDQCRLTGCTPVTTIDVDYSDNRHGLFINFHPSSGYAYTRNYAVIKMNGDANTEVRLRVSGFTSNDPQCSDDEITINNTGIQCRWATEPQAPIPDFDSGWADCDASLSPLTLRGGGETAFSVRVPDNPDGGSLKTPPEIRECNNYSITFSDGTNDFSRPVYLDYVPSNITQ
ncbi:MAG: hypothetical protein U9M92_03395 [Patescibacteria group bacterium]|nr:hypothetical protein [Patescibacteria group bacterium]